MLTIGCFEVVHLEGERWAVKNTRTSFSHITYGTLAELQEQLSTQTTLWEQRFAAHNGTSRAKINNRFRAKRT